jgi:hypothetical protein
MGQILPTREVLRDVHPAEAELAELLEDAISDEWIIIPNIWTAEKYRAPKEIDILLCHPKHGVLCIEVKGGPVEIRSGEWWQLNRSTQEWHKQIPSPPRQSRDSAFALRRFLRSHESHLESLEINWAVALVDCDVISASPLADLPRELLLLKSDLEKLESWVLLAASSERRDETLGIDGVAALVRRLLPNLKFGFDSDSRRIRQLERINSASAEQVRGLASLDLNQRVLVRGAAGTGKTRLAMMWAKQGAKARQKVLLTCYNEPLAKQIGEFLDENRRITVMPILRYFQELDVSNPLKPPSAPDEMDGYWNRELPDHVSKQLTSDHAVWDRIIVDELQDLSDLWLSMIERLLKPDGKLLCVADPKQDIYGRGLTWSNLDSWTLAELRRNCRNTRTIAKCLQEIGGAQPSSACAEGDPITFISPNPMRTVQELVESILVEETSPSTALSTLIITKTTLNRDAIRGLRVGGISVGDYESRSETLIPCETLRRSKGLESGHVILVDPSGELTQVELYIAISRAQHRLTVIAPGSIRETLAREVPRST